MDQTGRSCRVYRYWGVGSSSSVSWMESPGGGFRFRRGAMDCAQAQVQ